MDFETLNSSLWPSYFELAVIICMALTTYTTRIIGYVCLRKATISSRLKAVLDAGPCCVMVSVVAPSFITTDPLMIVALIFTIAISFKFNLAITICSSVAFMGILQHLF